MLRARLISDRPFWFAASFTVLVIVLGGGGTPNPLSEMLLQGFAVAFACLWLAGFARPLAPGGHPDGPGSASPTTSAGLMLLAAVVIALPALQLVPLPPQVWQALPGRDTQQAALALVDADHTWRPLALFPARTLAALIALGPPLLAMFLVARLDWQGRRRILAIIAAMAAITALFGALQLISGDPALRPYEHTHRGWLTGFQANRNATADLMLIGIVALAVWLKDEPRAKWGTWAAGGGLALLLALAIVLTGSRTGILLIAVALVASLWILAPRWAGLPRRAALATLGGLLALGGGAALMMQHNATLGRVSNRFSFRHDFRPELWTDSQFAMTQYWPAGVGMGGFAPALVAAERLEVVDESWPNRAHNDYLELAAEAGLPGLIALALVALVLLVMFARTWRTDVQRSQAIFATTSLAILALHSLVDYPLRSMAIASLAAIACAMLAPLRPASASVTSDQTNVTH